MRTVAGVAVDTFDGNFSSDERQSCTSHPPTITNSCCGTSSTDLGSSRSPSFKIGDARDILSGAAALAVESWHPLNSIGDRLGNTLVDGVVVTPPGTIEAYRALVDAGWVGVAAPKSAGGEGLPWIVANALNEIWSAASVALSLSMGLSMAAIGAIDASADEHLRATYLPAMVAGRWTGTMNLTEPQAGTDLAGIRAMARPNDDGTWAVKGQKIFTTWGDHDVTENIVHLVLARTPDAPEGLGGLSLFLVPSS